MPPTNVSAIVQYALNHGLQVNPDALTVIKSVDTKDLSSVIKKIVRAKLESGESTIGRVDLERVLGIGASDEEFKNEFEVVSDPTSRTASAEGVVGFGDLFVSRYEKMRALVSGRAEARLFKPIKEIKGSEVEEAHVCGLVWERTAATQDRPGRLTIEDPTGFLEFLVPYSKDADQVSTLMADQFVMVSAVMGRGGFVAKDITVPDVASQDPNRSSTNTYAVFLSDLHVGSQYFMEEEFVRFVEWLASDELIASRVGYVLLCGDVIDGVGIYPNQNQELALHTIEEQLVRLDELVAKIPERIKVIITPGNHDPGRKALPQPAIPRKYAPGLWKRPNVHMLGNPSAVRLNGVRVLMFHGQSIDDVVKVTPNLDYSRPVGVMEHLLRARHLSPIYGANTPTAPESEDMMVIEDDLDIFHAGHVHVVGAGHYRGVLLINSGTWQSKTPFQESVRMEPTPAMAVIVNLKTHKTTLRSFV